MRKNIVSLLYLLTAILCAVLRARNLQTGYDSTGLPISGHFSTLLLIGGILLSVLLLLWVAIGTVGIPSDHSVMQYRTAGASIGVLGGILLFAALLADFPAGNSGKFRIILFLLGIPAMLCMPITAILRTKKTSSYPLLQMAPVIWILLQLIYQFKIDWSIDPVVLDYAVRLFAKIAILIGLYDSIGFSMNIGKPRRTLFTCSCSTVLALCAATECMMCGTINELLFYVGSLLFLLPILHCLLKAAPLPRDVNKE